MLRFRPFSSARHPTSTVPPRRRAAALVEGLEGRVLLTFNAYIAGVHDGVSLTTYSFVFSTTGQAAKQWVIDWGDQTQDTKPAPNQITGFTTPQTWTHMYQLPGNYNVTAVATSTTNVTANAVLQENSGFGNTSSTGKEVQGPSDGASVGTSIATVVDENNNTYVLHVDGKRMAVTRFKPDGTIDTSAGWTTTGTYVLPSFTNTNNQDTPRAIAIDVFDHYLFVAGGSNNIWAIARVNYTDIRANPVGWIATIRTGTANALWFDTTDKTRLGVAGSSSSGQIEMAVLHVKDGFGFNGGSLDTSWGGGDGIAVADNSIYGFTNANWVMATASGIVEGDDVGFDNEEEWYVSGTVTYCQSSCTPPSGSDMVIVDFLSNGTTNSSFGNNGSGAAHINTTNCSATANYDSCYAMVPYVSELNGKPYITLVGTSDYPVNTTVLTERFAADTGMLDTDAYGPLVGLGSTRLGFATGPTGSAAYAAVLDKEPVSGAPRFVAIGSGGNNDFLAMRFKDDGTLDNTFGSGGTIKIDFGSTSGVTTDGGMAVSLRTINGALDILVGGYTWNASTSKYKIALVDLLDDHGFHVNS